MALNSIPMVPADGTITISDNTGTPISLTVQYEDGDFSAEEFAAGHWETEVFFDRGVPSSIRETKKLLVGWQFTAHATDFTDGTEKTLIDAAMKTGAFAAGVSTKGANYPVWLVKVVFTAEQSNFGLSADSVLTMNHNRIRVGFAEGIPGKFTIKGLAIPFADGDIAFT